MAQAQAVQPFAQRERIGAMIKDVAVTGSGGPPFGYIAGCDIFGTNIRA